MRGRTGPRTSKDPLGRITPQGTIFQFLEACHARDYSKAAYYLDLRRMPPADRAKNGSELAMQLEDLLDDTPFDIATLSRDPLGDQSNGVAASIEHLATFHVNGRALEMQLERVTLRPGLNVWLVSAPSVAMISDAHTLVAETGFEKRLPQGLVTFELLDTPVWRWIALMLMAAALWIASRLVSCGLVAMLRPLTGTQAFSGPLRVCLAVARASARSH